MVYIIKTLLLITSVLQTFLTTYINPHFKWFGKIYLNSDSSRPPLTEISDLPINYLTSLWSYCYVTIHQVTPSASVNDVQKGKSPMWISVTNILLKYDEHLYAHCENIFSCCNLKFIAIKMEIGLQPQLLHRVKLPKIVTHVHSDKKLQLLPVLNNSSVSFKFKFY